MGKHRDFKFGGQVEKNKFQPVDGKSFLKGAWSHHATHFKFLGPNHTYGTTEATVVKFCEHVGRIKLVVKG